MGRILLLLYLLALFLFYKVSGASVNSAAGTFNIFDGGEVRGQGSYSISNRAAEINLKLTIGDKANEVKDSGQAVITSVVTPAITLTPEDNQFIDDMIAKHNELRAIHFSPPLQNNTQMSVEAKKHALLLAAEKDLFHSPEESRPNEGESLAMGCTETPGEPITAEEATIKWYEEACCHNFSYHRFQENSGHFTQLVWKATEELGVGRAFGEKWGMNCSFIVARYKGKGNIDNEYAFKENVEVGTFDIQTLNCSQVACAKEEPSGTGMGGVGNDQNDNQQTFIAHSNPEVSTQNPSGFPNDNEHRRARKVNDFRGNRDDIPRIKIL